MRILNQTVTADGDVVFDWKNTDKGDISKGTAFVYGTFGSGTATFTVSPDGGTTYVPLKDVFGNAIAPTAAGMFNFELCADEAISLSDNIKIKISLSGATTPSLSYTVFNNQ